MKKIVALFDCDGTLYSARYGIGLLKYSSENGRKNTARMFYAAILPLYLLRKIKIISEETYQRPLISRLAWMVKGMTENELYQASNRISKTYLFPTERPETLKRLREHQGQGHLIVLVSAQLLPSLKTLGEHYHANGSVGTKIEMKDTRYTGRIISPVLIGEAKERSTREYFSTNGIDVDWEASYAYADSITDTSLLNMVGHPVAVNPDPELLVMAQTNNWDIIGITHNGL